MLQSVRGGGRVRRAATVARAVVGAGLLALPAAANEEQPPASGIAWQKSFPAALKQARATGKPVMAAFWAEWCPWCARLDALTYRDPGVIELSRSFVPVKVDTEGGLEEREITYEYGFVELPTIAFFSPRGRLLMKLGRYQGPEEFPATLRAALDVAERVGAWEAALDDVDEGRRAEGLAALGAHLFEQRRLDESREFLERSRKLDDTRPIPARKATRVLLGCIRLEQEKTKDAARLAREALALEPADPAEDARALVLLGKTLRETGQLDEARTSWEQAVRTDPEGAAAAEAREALRGVAEDL